MSAHNCPALGMELRYIDCLPRLASRLLLPPSGSYELHAANAEVGGADVGVQARPREWTVTADGASMPKPVLTPRDWLRRYEADTSVLPIPPLQCTQPAGTALFVPSGWKHAIMNEAPSVGVAVEVGDVDIIRRATAAAAQGGG